MEIEKAVDKKKELMDKVNELCFEFSKESGLKLEELKVTCFEDFDCKGNYECKVKIKNPFQPKTVLIDNTKRDEETRT